MYVYVSKHLCVIHSAIKPANLLLSKGAHMRVYVCLYVCMPYLCCTEMLYFLFACMYFMFKYIFGTFACINMLCFLFAPCVSFLFVACSTYTGHVILTT